MKIISFLGAVFMLFAACAGSAETEQSSAEILNKFPTDWIGHWKGELVVDQVGKLKAMELPMELIISETDSVNRWGWTIVYVTEEKTDRREYELVAKDSTYTHFIMDEKNSILLDQYLVGNRMISRFMVNGNMIFVEYRLEGDRIYSSMYGGPLSDSTVTGLELEPSEGVEKVISYRMRTVQRTVLRRQ